MCIVFLWRNKDHVRSGDHVTQFKFILAANRDEYFHRPAVVANYWKDHPNVLAGRDMTQGVEGGTWIGVSRQGKIGFLTNIRQHALTKRDPDKLGRGSLISDFLKREQNSGISAREYLDKISVEKQRYRPFNLMVGDVLGDLYYLNSVDTEQPQTLESAFTCLSNDVLCSKWLKVERSLKKFEAVINDAMNNSSTTSEVQDSLLKMLEDKERNFPDPNINVVHPGNEYRSSICLPLTDDQYGTRTNTIVTVDQQNHVTFLERTKLNLNDDFSKWHRSAYEFTIE